MSNDRRRNAIEAIVSSIEHSLRGQHPPYRPPMRRDAHPKHHGCVRAEFTVEDDRLDLAPYRYGVLARPGQTYHCWVRFSNALKTRHDLAPDARGMAVKLMDVEGSASGTQDFLMVSHHSFFARTAEEFVDFPAAVSDRTFTLRTWGRMTAFFIGPKGRRPGLAGLMALARSLKPTWNPLAMTYFSQVPFKLGPTKLMKFCVRPHEPAPLLRRAAIWIRALPHVFPFINKRSTSGDMLRHALVDRLRRGDARFDFCVQMRDVPVESPERTRIEDDALTGWNEGIFPYRKVAEIRIRKLDPDFDEKTMMTLGEHLSFTPWHNVPEHEPVGSINEARRVTYERISTLRHEQNRKRRLEPRSHQTAAEYLAAIDVSTTVPT
jgi:hypothetical protein